MRPEILWLWSKQVRSGEGAEPLASQEHMGGASNPRKGIFYIGTNSEFVSAKLRVLASRQDPPSPSALPGGLWEMHSSEPIQTRWNVCSVKLHRSWATSLPHSRLPGMDDQASDSCCCRPGRQQVLALRAGVLSTLERSELSQDAQLHPVLPIVGTLGVNQQLGLFPLMVSQILKTKMIK